LSVIYLSVDFGPEHTGFTVARGSSSGEEIMVEERTIEEAPIPPYFDRFIEERDRRSSLS
jgi:hypothetical protein